MSQHEDIRNQGKEVKIKEHHEVIQRHKEHEMQQKMFKMSDKKKKQELG